MQIRRATIADMDEIARLYRDTIIAIDAKDYSKEQIEAWVSTYDYQEGWVRRLEEQYFYVAVIDHKIVGFASMDKFGYLDLLYIHKDYQGQGIATKLEAKLEEVAKETELNEITVQSSIGSKPFFEHRGYKVTGEKHKLVKNIPFTNTVMSKKLE
ncbi:MAG: GNAT family N-acetyltransferase [Bacteroidia bacterium]